MDVPTRHYASLPRLSARTASVALPIRSSEALLDLQLRKDKTDVEGLNRWSTAKTTDLPNQRLSAESLTQYMTQYTELDSLVMQRRSRKAIPRAASQSQEQIQHIMDISKRRMEQQTHGQQLKDNTKFAKRLEEDLEHRAAQLQTEFEEVTTQREDLRSRNTELRDQLSNAHLTIKTARVAANRVESMLKSKMKSLRSEDLGYVFSKRSACQLDLFNREQEYQESLCRLNEEITANSSKALELDTKARELRVQIRSVHDKQVSHYQELLAAGVDTRSEGLSWAVKALWRLGEKVEMDMFPAFLDMESIHVILFLAQKSMEVEELTGYISEIQTTRRRSITSLVSRGDIQGRLSALKNPISASRPSFSSAKPLLPDAHSPFRAADSSLQSNTVEERVNGLKLLIQKTQMHELRRLTRDCFMNNLEKKVRTGAHQILSAVAGAETLSRQMAAITKEQKELADELRKTKTFSFSAKQ